LLPAGLKAADPENWPVATDVEQLHDDEAVTLIPPLVPVVFPAAKLQVLAFAIWVEVPGTRRTPTRANITPIESIDRCIPISCSMTCIKIQ
jgi:hypothetical protein